MRARARCPPPPPLSLSLTLSLSLLSQVTPALGLAAAASALASSRPNLLYVTAGVVGGRAALEGTAAAVSAGVSTRLPPLAQLPAPAVHALAALVRAAPAAIAAVYLDAAAPPEAAGLLRGSGAGAVV